MPDLVVPARFNGPPASANGGWSAGALAALLLPPEASARPVSVRLHRPPPLDVPMSVEVADDTATARIDGDVVLTAAVATEEALGPDLPAVDLETATAATVRYAGRQDHPFPTCFVCGTQRSDGLRLEPGHLLFREEMTACPWTPPEDLDAGDGRVALPVVWAALDCPGGWSADLVGRPMVLGTITAAVPERPRVGEPCVVVGTVLGRSGRRTLTATALRRAADGALLARAAHIWVEVDPTAFSTP